MGGGWLCDRSASLVDQTGEIGIGVNNKGIRIGAPSLEQGSIIRQQWI